MIRRFLTAWRLSRGLDGERLACLVECAHEAARLNQGPIPEDEQDDPARRFWKLYAAGACWGPDDGPGERVMIPRIGE